MTTTVNSTTSPVAASAATGVTTASTSNAAQDASDRFLKLLVTQMQNQDPLSPMDNAQVTSQMAQINTVTGIDKLNQTMQGMSTQFMQMQALQGASLVGRSVLIEGNELAVSEGKGSAGFDLDSAADKVTVEVVSASGKVVDSIDMGAQGAGRHGFEWTAPAGVTDTSGLTFRVVAKLGTADLVATPLEAQQVSAVNTSADTLTLELANGTSIPYSKVKAFA